MASTAARIGKLIRSIMTSAVEPVAQAADMAVRRPEFALRRELQTRATREAADIVQSEMPDALYCKNRFVNLEYALSLRPPGLLLEFGVYKGETITHIASLSPSARVYGFDSFRGLPEHWKGNRFSYKNFDRSGELPKVPGNVQLVAGLFEDTLPSFLDRHSDPIGFVHIDCDIYSSTKYVLTTLNDRLARGCVVVFDEFFNYPGFQQHERRAFREFIAETGRSHQFVSYSGHQATTVINGDATEIRVSNEITG